jgi:hypothetical protein
MATRKPLGTIAIHGAVRRYSRPAAIRSPSDIAGGCTPRPRNDSADSRRMMAVKFALASTITGVATFGRTCASAIRAGRAPSASLAST